MRLNRTIYYILFALIICNSVNGISAPRVHDPVMAKGEDGRYYIFSTGMGINVMSSTDLSNWKIEKSVFNKDTEIPKWAKDSVKRYHGHTWAPDISYQNGRWLLYYSCSTFGKNTSAIGVATNKTLDPNSKDFKWEDQGMVIKSSEHKDNWNAIDPNLIVTNNKRILVYGSFWDGIQLIKLAEDFKTPISKPTTIARRIEKHIQGKKKKNTGDNAIEAPFIIYNDGYYYLFVSWDYCCRGQASTYKTVYGRSKKIEGPYVDKEGKAMIQGGGTILCGPDNEYFGIGHCSAYEFDGKWYFISHAYDKKHNGDAVLFLREMDFDQDGWIQFKHPIN